jgi:tetratricopeptide (TPR) repeat protein
VIRVIRGRRQQLNNYFYERLNTSRNCLWLIKAKHTTSSWEPLCDLFDQVAQKIGSQPVEQILSDDLAAASFAYEDRIAQLSSEQKSQRLYYSTRYSSHLSHNWYLHRPLFEAWARMLYRVLTLPGVKGQPLIVPRSSDMVGPVKTILKTISRLYPDSKSDFTIVIGFESEVEPPQHDENGINWNLSSANPRFAGGLLQVADVVENLPEDSNELLDHVQRPPRDGGLPTFSENIAYRALESSNSLDSEQVSQLIQAMELAYQGLGFQNTLELGLKLMACKPVLSSPQKAKVHGLMALAAHNRQFSATDTRLHEFLLYHFTQAYKHEVEPSMRSALCYRIAVTYGRRMKQAEVGLEWAEKALSEASSPQLTTTEQVYYHNWGINIKAFLLMRTRQLELAYQVGESVFNTVHQHFQGLLENPVTEQNASNKLWQREFFATMQVLRQNMFALCYYTAKLPQFRYWLDKMEEITPPGPELRRATYVEWAEYYSALLQHDKVLEVVAIGLGHLRQEPETELFLHYSKHATSANYRVGNLSESHDHLEQYRKALDNIGMPWFFEFDLVKYAPIYLRSGIESSLMRVIELSKDDIQTHKDDNPKCVEYLLLRGQAYARQQNREAAEQTINEAIEIAVAFGERNLMMKVARIAGCCNDIMNSSDEALEAFHQALELSRHESDIPPWPEELFLTHIAIQNKQGPNLQSMEQALRILPEALEQMDTWWELRSTLLLLIDLSEKDQQAYKELISRQSLQPLIQAASQRDDCADALEALFSIDHNQQAYAKVS